jgi:hypothetical protein
MLRAHVRCEDAGMEKGWRRGGGRVFAGVGGFVMGGRAFGW